MRSKVKIANNRMSYMTSSAVATNCQDSCCDGDGYTTEDCASRNVRFAATPDLVAEDMASLMQLCPCTPDHAQASPWAGKRISRKKPDSYIYGKIFGSNHMLSLTSSTGDEEVDDDYEDLRVRGLKIHNQR